jgi:glycerol kinase
MDLSTNAWAESLLSLFEIPAECLPTIIDSTVTPQFFAKLDDVDVPICGIAGDQQAALFGQGCTHPQMAKNTYGTGCFLLMNTGHDIRYSSHRLLTTAACAEQSSATSGTQKLGFALEGSVFVGGAVVQWLRDGLGLIKESAEIEALVASVPDNGGIYMVPAFTGLGSPHWDPNARGMLIGLTRGTQAGHVARAALESIAFQSTELLQCMAADAQQRPTEIRVDGGACRNNLLMQIQADLMGVPVIRPTITETTALGAAYLAGLGVGIWSSTAEIESFRKVDRIFDPTISADEAAERMTIWSRAVTRAKNWAEIPS